MKNSQQLEMDLSTKAEPSSKELLCFFYKNELFIRVIPVKNLFRSNLIHGVVNRGDIFAMRLSDQALTVIPGTAVVQHVTLAVDAADAVPVTKVDRSGS